ncbi:hypothetical protein D9M71_494350 [compost metagenome]
MPDPLRDDNAELTEQPTNCVSLRSTSLHKTLPRPMHGQYPLLLCRLDRYEAHIGSSDRFTNGLCIGYVVLVRFHIGLNKLWSHQLDRMSKCLQLSCPVMGTSASLHTDQARRQYCKERGKLVTFELLLQYWFPSLVNSVYLKHVFCQIDTNSRKLHEDAPFR